jgi:hypothetical protein
MREMIGYPPTTLHTIPGKKKTSLLFTTESIFTVVILQILVWIFEVDMHSCVFILDFPDTIE